MTKSKEIIVALFFLFLSMLSLSFGTVPTGPGEAVEAVLQFLREGTSSTIGSDAVVYLRLPHFVLAFFAGCGLALCGTVMQAVTRNPLADPYLLGISSGAALGAVLAIVFGVDGMFGVSGIGVSAFLGAMAVCLLILLFSQFLSGNQMLVIILAGFAFNALCAAGLNFIIMVMAEPSKTRSVQFWLLGNLQADRWDSILVLGLILLAGCLYFYSQRRILDLMLVGDEVSLTMGRKLATYRKIYILVTAFMTSCLVCLTGTIGFVGLVIPHLVRRMAGSAHRTLLPLAALGGGCFLSWADVLGRMLVSGVTIPVGVAAAVCGAPFFVWMLLSGKWGGRS